MVLWGKNASKKSLAFYILFVYTEYIQINFHFSTTPMKKIRYDEEERIKILTERGIDLHLIAIMFNEGEMVDKVKHPTRDGQVLYIILYE